MNSESKSAVGEKSGRLAFLDWARGSVALVMIQGHVFHSFTHKDLRNEAPYVLSQFIGGMTPAVFLFLTGVTLAFMMDSRAQKGMGALERMWSCLGRVRYFIVIAALFRIQLWAFAFGQSPWTDLFKVDILNCMAASVLILTPLAAFETRDRTRLGAVVGLAIAIAAPLMSNIDWSGVHPFVWHYFVPDFNAFPLFPWGAFVAFGLSAGSVLRLVREDDDQMRVMQWSGIFGIALIMAARLFSDMPYSLYPKSDFWLNSPLLIFIKTGVILLLLPFAYVWTRFINPVKWSFVRQLGTTSLLVYWVHTELVYGRWFWKAKENLGTAATAASAVAMIALMLLLSIAQTGWRGGPNMKDTWRRFRDQFRPLAPPSGATGD